ncbi:MAG: adenine phosphoribosyltransferase [Gemmatimonadetes bacterium]|nr:adenine phosphoribosyltransferase [Gemmatimonadota bacterium]
MQRLEERVRAAVRDVPDFPKPGIVFKDITSLLLDAALFREVTDAMVDWARAADVTHVVGIESRGFIFGAPVAQALGAGFVPMRKPGKLPGVTVSERYALEYGTDTLEVRADAFTGSRGVMIVDDVLATGGTAAAACRLVARAGGTVVLCGFLMELGFLDGRSLMGDRRVDCLLRY